MAANDYALQFTASSLDRGDFNTAAKAASIRNLDAFTLEAHIKVGSATSGAAKAYLERQNSGKNPRLALTAYNDSVKGTGILRFEFSRRDNKADTDYTYVLPADWDDYWHHVAFAVDVDAATYELFYDGAIVASGSVPDGGTGLSVPDTAPAHIIVGAGYNGTTYTYWDGKLDCVRLWNSALSQGTIQSNNDDYLSDPSSETNLLEEWRFGEGSPDTDTHGIENPTWDIDLKRNGSASSALWTSDRPFIGDGLSDTTDPTDPTMSAPTNITDDGFTLNFSGGTDDVYVQYYEITVATDNLFASPVAGYAGINVGLVSTYDVSGLSPSTNYYARVRILDAALNASDYVTYNSNAAIVTSASGDVTAPATVTATAATSVTATSFSANWNATTDDTAVTGYKLDVALDADFTEFLAGFTNLDVGLVTTYSVSSGVVYSTPYYYRVRAYDAAENESSDSNTVTVTTSPPADTTPPDVVVTTPATSVGSTSFTANWNVGVDNVGVTAYKLDVATDEAFLSMVTGYNDLDVGNVLSYGVTGLTPETGYYYRVRACDAAGNEGDDAVEGQLVTTSHSLVDEGGYLTVAYEPTEDTYTDENTSTTNYGDATSLSVDGTVSNVNDAYLKFDLTEAFGEIINARLSLYVSDASTGTIVIKKVETGTWDEDTLTYANESVTLSTEQVTFDPSATGWVEVDVASLLDDGFVEYSLVLTTTETDVFAFDSREGTNPLYLELELDPNTITENQTMDATSAEKTITNLLKNPSGETGGASYGGSTGIVVLGSSTLTQDNTYAYAGTYSVNVDTTAAANDGVTFESDTGLATAISSGDVLKAIAFVRADSFTGAMTIRVNANYTDVTTDSAVYTLSDPDAFVHGSDDEWTAFEVEVSLNAAKTLDQVTVDIEQDGSIVNEFWVDAVCAAITDESLVYFSGDSLPQTDWNGTANASTSTLKSYVITAVSTYVGDSDEDNSTVAEYQQYDETDWRLLATPTTNRSTKQITSTVPAIGGINYVSNPSFSNNLDHVSIHNGTTISRITTDGMDDPLLAYYGCMQVVGTAGSADEGFALDQHFEGVQNDVVTFSAYLKSVAGEADFEVKIIEYSSAGVVQATNTDTWNTTTAWARYETNVTLSDASTAYVRVFVEAVAQETFTLNVDHMQFEFASAATAYHDGSEDTSEWEGNEHNSRSYRLLQPLVRYSVQHTVTDADGVLGGNPLGADVTNDALSEDAITIDALTVTAEQDRLTVLMSYTGDDNSSAYYTVEWKRNDLSVWSTVAHSVDTANKNVEAVIAGLRGGTAYNVRVTIYDDDDPVYGATYVSTNEGYVESTVFTTADDGFSSTPPNVISFGGFVMQGEGADWIGISQQDAMSLPERRTQIEELARDDGGVELSDWWGTRDVNLRGFVHADDRGTLQQRIRQLRLALAPRQQRLVVDTLDSQGYYFVATCTALDITEVAGDNIFHVEFDAEFSCADPFRYEQSETVESDINMMNDDTVVISNDGDLSIPASFTITTTSTNALTLTLTNTTTGERIRPTSSITSGDSLVIDSSKLSVRKNGVEIDYEGAFPTLAVGTNTMKMTLSADDVYLTVKRRHRFF